MIGGSRLAGYFRGLLKNRTVSSKQHKWRGSWCPIYQVAMSHLSSLMANIHFFSREFLLSKLYYHCITSRLHKHEHVLEKERRIGTFRMSRKKQTMSILAAVSAIFIGSRVEPVCFHICLTF